MRVGLIGPGNFAMRGPLPAIAMTPGIELTAVQGRNRAAAERAAGQFGGAAICDSVAELCARRDVDAVFIVTPPEAHPGVLAEVIEARKPLICDKPVTFGSRYLAPLVRAAEESGVPNAVDHEFRYDPAMGAIADLLREGAIGRVRSSSLSAIATFANDPAFESLRYWNFHHSAVLGGGMLAQFASHLLDLHLYFFGGLEPMGGYAPALVREKPTRPAVAGGPAGPMKPVEAEDSAALAAKLPGEGTAALSLSYVATAMPDLRWTIHGDDGAIAYDGKDGWFGGRLALARGWKGAAEDVPLAPRRHEQDAPGLDGWMQDLIGELLLDFATVLGGQGGECRFATLRDELTVWTLIEQWRG